MDSSSPPKGKKNPVLDDDPFGAVEAIDGMYVEDFEDFTGLRVSNMPEPRDNAEQKEGEANKQKGDQAKLEQEPTFIESRIDNSGTELRSMERLADYEEFGATAPSSLDADTTGKEKTNVPEDTTSKQPIRAGANSEDKLQPSNNFPDHDHNQPEGFFLLPGVTIRSPLSRRLSDSSDGGMIESPSDSGVKLPTTENEAEDSDGFFLLPGVRIGGSGSRPIAASNTSEVTASPPPSGVKLPTTQNEAEDSNSFFLLPGDKNEPEGTASRVSSFEDNKNPSADNSATESEDSDQFHRVKLDYVPPNVSQNKKVSEADEEIERIVSHTSDSDHDSRESSVDGAENVLLPYSSNESEVYEASGDDGEDTIVSYGRVDIPSSANSDDESEHSQESVHGVKLPSGWIRTPKDIISERQEPGSESNITRPFDLDSANSGESKIENPVPKTTTTGVDNQSETPSLVSQDDRGVPAVQISIERAELAETGSGDKGSPKLPTTTTPLPPIHDNNTFGPSTNSSLSLNARRASHVLSDARSEDSRIFEGFPEIRYSTDNASRIAQGQQQPISNFTDGRYLSPLLVHNVTGNSRISDVSSEDPTSFNPFTSPKLPNQTLTSSDQGRVGIESNFQEEAGQNSSLQGRAASEQQQQQQHVPVALLSYNLKPSALSFTPRDPAPYNRRENIEYLENIAAHFQQQQQHQRRAPTLMASPVIEGAATVQDGPLADIFPAAPEGPLPSIKSRRVPRTHQRQPSLPTLRESSPRLYEATAPLENENQHGFNRNQQPTHGRNFSGSYMGTENRSYWPQRPPGYSTAPKPQTIAEEQQYETNAQNNSGFDGRSGNFRSFSAGNQRHSRDSSHGSAMSIDTAHGIPNYVHRFAGAAEGPFGNSPKSGRFGNSSDVGRFGNSSESGRFGNSSESGRGGRYNYNAQFNVASDSPQAENRFGSQYEDSRSSGYPGSGSGRPNNNRTAPETPNSGYNSRYDHSRSGSGQLCSPPGGYMQNSNSRFAGFEGQTVNAEAREPQQVSQYWAQRNNNRQDYPNHSLPQDPAILHSVVRSPQGPTYSNRQNHWSPPSNILPGAFHNNGPPNDPAIQGVYTRHEFIDPAIVTMSPPRGGNYIRGPRQPSNPVSIPHHHQQQQPYQQHNLTFANMPARSPPKGKIPPAVPRPVNLLPILEPLHRSASRSPTPVIRGPRNQAQQAQWQPHQPQQRAELKPSPIIEAPTKSCAPQAPLRDYHALAEQRGSGSQAPPKDRPPPTQQRGYASQAPPRDCAPPAPARGGPQKRTLKPLSLADRPDPKEQERKREEWILRAQSADHPQNSPPLKQEIQQEEPLDEGTADDVVIMSTWKKVEIRNDGRRKFVGDAVRTEHKSNDPSPVSPDFKIQGSSADAVSGNHMAGASPEEKALPPHLRNKKNKVENAEQEPPKIRMLGEVPQEVIDSVEVSRREAKGRKSPQKGGRERLSKNENPKPEQIKQDKPKLAISKPPDKAEVADCSPVKRSTRIAATTTATKPQLPQMVNRGTQTDGGAGIPKLKIKELDDSILESHVIKHIYRNAVEIYKDGDYNNAEVSLHRVVHQLHLQLHPDQHPRGNNNNNNNGNRMPRTQRSDPNRTALLAYFPNRHPPRAPVRDDYISASLKLAICQLKLGHPDAARTTLGNIHDELANPDGPREQTKESRLLTETSDGRIMGAVYRLLAYLYGTLGRDTLTIAKTLAKNAVIIYTEQYGDGTSFWNEEDERKAEDEEWATVYESDGVHPFRSDDSNGNIYSEINKPSDKNIKKKRRHEDRQGYFKDVNKGREWEGNWECGNGHIDKKVRHWDCSEELKKSVRLLAAVLESMSKGQTVERLEEKWEAAAYREMLKERMGEVIRVEKVGRLRLRDVLCQGDMEL